MLLKTHTFWFKSFKIFFKEKRFELNVIHLMPLLQRKNRILSSKTCSRRKTVNVN